MLAGEPLNSLIRRKMIQFIRETRSENRTGDVFRLTAQNQNTHNKGLPCLTPAENGEGLGHKVTRPLHNRSKTTQRHNPNSRKARINVQPALDAKKKLWRADGRTRPDQGRASARDAASEYIAP